MKSPGGHCTAIMPVPRVPSWRQPENFRAKGDGNRNQEDLASGVYSPVSLIAPL